MKEAILITGGNGNLGSLMVGKYLADNKHLIVFHRDSVNKIEKFLEKKDNKLLDFNLDLLNLEKVEAAIDKSLEKGFLPNRIIHTASMRSIDFKKLADSDPLIWEKVARVNTVGTYNILKAVIPVLRKNNGGKIVLFGSNVSKIGLNSGSAYSASKAFIANLCRSVAYEESENNILINTVSPGPINIDHSHFSEEYQQFRQKYYDEQLKQIPMDRLAELEEVFNLCDFLISEKNTYITGEEYFITGGRH